MAILNVLVSGGGIGGLSAALSLASRQLNVTVLEQADRISEIGAGIQLSPNCTRVLFALGLEEALQEVAFYPTAGQMRAWNTGEVLTESRLGKSIERLTGYPYLHIHRADLIGVLARKVSECAAINLITDASVLDFTQNGEEVALRYTTPAGEKTLAGDVLIGADGIRSVVREGLFGAETPRFTGNVAWRALVPADRLPEGMVRPMSTAWWGPRGHFVHYYVRRGELVNCVCVKEKVGWEVESWTERGEFEELKADFAGWHEDIQTLIDNADRQALYKWALFDRKPMRSWSKGRVTLLGDACHPTLPFMAQGAAMAIEDGAVLAGCLSDLQHEVEPALRRYEMLRKARTARIQNGSRRNARLFHMRGVRARVRNLVVKHGKPRNPWADLFTYDALTAHKQANP